METKSQDKELHDRKPRLLIATDNFLPRWDGVARFLSEIIPRLVSRFDITVVAPDFGTYEDPNIKIVKIPLTKLLKVGDFQIPKFKKTLIRALVRENDLVFCQTIGPIGMSAINAAKHYRKPLASFIHSIEWELVPKALDNILLKKYSQILTKRIARKLYNKCNILIMPSYNVSELFLWNNIRTRSEIVHLGVDTEKFKPAIDESTRNDLKKKLDLNPHDIILGYHGRISREKDPMTLLRAFTRLHQYNNNLRLLIVGDGIESLKKQLSRRGVLLVGSKNNPVPYLQIMDIYCLTSLTETTCLSMLEAMSCGIACISTEVGFIKSYIKNNYNGLFFEKQNPYHLARQIERLIKDPKSRLMLGNNARKTVIEKFSWDKTAEGIDKALLGLMVK